MHVKNFVLVFSCAYLCIANCFFLRLRNHFLLVYFFFTFLRSSSYTCTCTFWLFIFVIQCDAIYAIELNGMKDFVGFVAAPRRRNPLGIRHPALARVVYALHILVGLVVASLGLWLCWWAPSTSAKENSYWSGLIVSWMCEGRPGIEFDA